ncbi:MAG TPA: spore germination protein [Lachnospiraceae bacterium]|nr:spore germination protein [Lachnospiraceae bacterium]
MQNLYSNLDKNIAEIKNTFKDAGDIVFREFYAGSRRLFMVYADNVVHGDSVNQNILTNLMLRGGEETSTLAFQLKSIAVGEVAQVTTFEQVYDAVLLGDTVVFSENDNVAVQISTKGWPTRGIPAVQTEVTLLGPKDAFTEQGSTNIVLVRRRIRDTRLKVKRMKIGSRSKTDVAVMYMQDIVRDEILEETLKKLSEIDADAIIDSGYLQQFIEESFLSPFPQLQLTERPDKTASAIYEGRIAIIVDNSPFVILVPATLNVFFQASDDYYQRWEIMSFLRLMRFVGAAAAATLPGLYIALVVFHPNLIPTSLALKIAGGRANVPFPTIVEVLIMELAFELLREAGLRLPSPASSTIGIVGGIVIGQAAVDAGIVGPMVVIIAALTGISSFAIPNVELVNSVRLIKYMLILFCSCFGLVGFWLGVLLILSHLSALSSYGIPYLFPFCSGSVNNYSDLKDSLIRVPLIFMKNRPIFAKKDSTVRLNRKRGENNGSKK